MKRALLALVVLLAACSSGDDDDAADAQATTTTPTTTAPSYDPSFVERPCEEPVPEDPRIECGDLTVPENRADPDAGDVVLPVAIVRSASADPAPDPIVFVSGGPGDGALGVLDFVLDSDVGGDRDVVVYDQRGTGEADPDLDCPEAQDAFVQNATTADAVTVEDVRLDEGHVRCRDRLIAAGIDLDQYDSVAQAADLADLRVALGVDEWNIWALSYGATTTLELVRTRPEGVRSMFLDAGLPVDEPRGSDDFAVLAFDAIEALFAACAADSGCAAAYPTLEADYRALVAEWDAEPFEIVASAPDGSDRTFLVSGSDVVGGTYDALYDTGLIPVLPSLIAPLRERGDAATAIVRPLLEDTFDPGVAEGVERSVICADRMPLEDLVPDRPLPDPLVELFAATELETTCAHWDVEPLPASFTEPVTSDVPALVAVGGLDPVQPPAVARRMAETLGESTVVELPGLGHGVLFGSPCGVELLQSFVATADPDAVDTSCVDALGPPQWAV